MITVAMPSAPAAVLFDLDGTLLDTAPDLIGALNRVLLEQNRDPVAVADFRRWVSQGGRRLLREGFPDLDQSRIEDLLPCFLSYYEAHIAEHTLIYPGVDEVLGELDHHAIPWAIVTNKPIGLTHMLLRAIGWEGRTPVVIGGDSLAERKPHPLPLQVALQRLGASAANACMVGDDLRDIQAGQQAHCLTLIARWGYLDRPDQLAQWGADGIVERPLDLLGRWFSSARASA